MTIADALLLALGAVTVGFGALVVTTAHLVRAGLYLVISLGATAGLYLVLGAELVAWVQVLVYVGAVVVLLLFAVMLTKAPIGPSADLDRPAAPAALVGAGVGFGLAALLTDAFRWTRYDVPPPGTAQRVGEQVFGGWVLPFEVLSILLLAALVGAIVLSRPEVGARPDPEAQADADQPPPDPVAESDEVVARLERIAARQAAAQARVRQAAAQERSASSDQGAEQPAATPPADPVDEARRQTARDVILGAHERRPRVGVEAPAEPTGQPDVIEGTAFDVPDRPALDPSSGRRAVTGREQKAIEGRAEQQRDPGAIERPASGEGDD